MNKNTLIRMIQESPSLSYPAKQEMIAKANAAGDDQDKLDEVALELRHISGGSMKMMQTKEQKVIATK